eukprot:1718647-Rhodomonas_salina.1
MFYHILLNLRELQAEDPITDPFNELMGREDPDCFVVDSVRDYDGMRGRRPETWPSDAVLERVEIAHGVGESAAKFSAVATFPGCVRLVVDWERGRVSVDCRE